QALFEAENRGDLDSASSIWCTWGFDALESDRVPLADTAFTEAFHLIRLHKLPRNQSRVLRGLARARSGMGDYSSAKLLFDAAITAPTGTEVRWVNLTARGKFRLEYGDSSGAFEDFRQARRFLTLMRTEMVPSDQDRIALE